MKITLVIVLAAALVGGLIGAVVGLALDGKSSDSSSTASAATVASETTPTASAAPGSSSESAQQVYRQDAPGVVVITSTETQKVPATFFSPATTEKVSALGSGFVIDKQGNVLTNDHVVQGGKNIRVGFSSGATYPAKIVGADPSSDIAVVHVDAPASALHPLPFDSSSSVQVGDPVYAIGNPFGLDRTMTAGIVSATGRDIQAPNGLTIPNAIQTDAAINHGNSGGPLLDRAGRVIGVNDQIESGNNGNVGVGFAISSDTARSVADELIKTGHAQHAWLGVEADTIDPTLVGAVRGLPSHGVALARVLKGSPAARAGLKGATHAVTSNGLSVPVGGDTIVAVDGKSITTSQQLADAIGAHRPGDRVQLTVVRAGKTRTATVTLGNVPTQH